MNDTIAMKLSVIIAVAALAACKSTDLLEKDVADLKAQMTQVQSELQAARRTADQASTAASAASQVASSARSSADQALAAAQSTDEKIDRALRMAVAK